MPKQLRNVEKTKTSTQKSAHGGKLATPAALLHHKLRPQKRNKDEVFMFSNPRTKKKIRVLIPDTRRGTTGA